MLQNLITKFDHGVWKIQLDLTEMNEKYDKADLILRQPKIILGSGNSAACCVNHVTFG